MLEKCPYWCWQFLLYILSITICWQLPQWSWAWSSIGETIWAGWCGTKCKHRFWLVTIVPLTDINTITTITNYHHHHEHPHKHQHHDHGYQYHCQDDHLQLHCCGTESIDDWKSVGWIANCRCNIKFYPFIDKDCIAILQMQSNKIEPKNLSNVTFFLEITLQVHDYPKKMITLCADDRSDGWCWWKF